MGAVLCSYITNKSIDYLTEIQGPSDCREFWSGYYTYILDYKTAHGKVPEKIPNLIQYQAAGYGASVLEISKWRGLYVFDYKPNSNLTDAELTIYFIFKDKVYKYDELGNGRWHDLKQIQDEAVKNLKENPIK